MPLAETYALKGLAARGRAYGPVRLWGSFAFIFGNFAAGVAADIIPARQPDLAHGCSKRPRRACCMGARTALGQRARARCAIGAASDVTPRSCVSLRCLQAPASFRQATLCSTASRHCNGTPQVSTARSLPRCGRSVWPPRSSLFAGAGASAAVSYADSDADGRFAAAGIVALAGHGGRSADAWCFRGCNVLHALSLRRDPSRHADVSCAPHARGPSGHRRRAILRSRPAWRWPPQPESLACCIRTSAAGPMRRWR